MGWGPPSRQRVCQIGYITNDMDAATALLGERHGAGDFFVRESRMTCTADGVDGTAAMRVAFAHITGMQIEIIEPQAGLTDIYAAPLKRRAAGTTLIHHLGVMILGGIGQWQATMDGVAAAGRSVAFTGEVGADARFAYVDDRATTGHYTEYLWATLPRWEEMDRLIAGGANRVAALPFRLSEAASAIA